MPVSVLLIEGSEDHAQAVTRALVDPWLDWRLLRAASVGQARALLAGERIDIVLVARRLHDGSAYDVFASLQGQPTLMVVHEGEEADAALAMRHGFVDFVVRDADGRYLLNLPAQLEAALERSTEKRARQQAEAMLARQHRLLQAISQAQGLFIASAPPRAAFEALLQEVLVLTQSAFGVVGQVEHRPGQAPLLRVHAITDISWDDASRARYAQVAEQGMVFDNPQSLVGAALISGEPLISNQPASDPRSGGLPHGHPPLTAFMGLPIHAAGQLVAMVGVANRAGGYSSADVHFLQPLLNSVGQLEMARRADIERREVEARWRSLTQLSSDWYWEQDAEFRFVRFEGNAHSSGLPNPNHLGLTRWELPDAIVSETQWRVHRAQLQAHEVFHDFEMQRLDADGAPIWVSISGEPIFDGEGNFTGYRGLARNITERKRAEAEIQRLAFFDELTGLPNRRLLLERLERVAAACGRGACHGALLFLDLDNFKNVNDTLGHECGDRLLLQAGQRVVECVRTTDTVARLGGDEFVVILQGLHAREPEAAVEAEVVAQKILRVLNQPYDVQGSEVHSTPSIGIAMFRSAQPAAQELLQRADLAMYQAKAQGRNTMCFFDPAMQASATARSALEADIRQGLQRGEFLLHYQPVVDVHGVVLGAEALVRWEHPQRGMVYPGDFIALAEHTGLILPLGRQVLQAACEQLVRWSGAPVSQSWTVAVNVSTREFRHPDYVQQVLEVLQQTGADPCRLKLELTESLLLHDVEDGIAKMQVLRKQGVGFSLDDFGTGYSSLSYLKRLPLDQLKIDQGFVRDVLTDPNDAAIACTVITLAHSLGLEVVAEGVESQG
ncbi:MAG: EAL domain-containing protein, partial [Burkholderiaceae bacterium]|nr:EAL domain-containing protein [Burkholderiaceae bacterium]